MEALQPDGKLDCRTLWISDVHLGSSNCKAQYLLQLLKRVRCQRIYLVGDIVDVWAMHRRVYWPESHNLVLRQLLSKSRAGVEVFYIPGNHDQNFREFCGNDFGHVKVRKEMVHLCSDGRRMLVTHGDELDYAVRYSRINRVMGDVAYDLLMSVNRWVNRFREWRGQPYWSLARWVKSHVGKAEQAIDAYQQAAVALARQRGFDGIICGNLHFPLIRQYGETLYCNDGDWVENCTAMVEDSSGALRLVQAVGVPNCSDEILVASLSPLATEQSA
jgi:UDP-2,3-diacylglucosamine pyrophosphatase LpxH